MKDEGVILKGGRLEGQLVAHSDGFWHLFSDKDEDSDKDKEFLSLPDEQVLAVRFHERAAEPTVDKWTLFLSLIATISAGFWGIIWLTTREVLGPSWAYGIGGLVALLFLVVAFFAGFKVRKRIRNRHSQDKRGQAE